MGSKKKHLNVVSEIKADGFVISDLSFVYTTVVELVCRDMKIKNAKFDNSQMYCCSFVNIEFVNVSFNQSTFKNEDDEETLFENVTFKNCSFDDTIFHHTKFINCKGLKEIQDEGAIFIDVEIEYDRA